MLPELYLDRRLAELQWVRGYAGVPGESGPIAWQENPLSNGRGQSQDISLVYLKLMVSDMYIQPGEDRGPGHHHPAQEKPSGPRTKF